MANQVFEIVRTVMAVREYADKELPDDVVRRIVEAGHLTASASNVQPWHFVLVRNPDALRKLGSLVRTGPYVSAAAAAGMPNRSSATTAAERMYHGQGPIQSSGVEATGLLRRYM